MTGLGSAAALLLAGAFAWAALAKIVRQDATRDAFAALGLPAPRALAAVLPAAELALAALLALRPRAGAVAALAALALFSAVLATRARQGRSVGCGCFGASDADAASSTAVVRNVLLAGAAALALAAPGAVRPDLPGAMAVGALAVIGLLVVALWDLRERTGRLWDNRVEETGT